MLTVIIAQYTLSSPGYRQLNVFEFRQLLHLHQRDALESTFFFKLILSNAKANHTKIVCLGKGVDFWNDKKITQIPITTTIDHFVWHRFLTTLETLFQSTFWSKHTNEYFRHILELSTCVACIIAHVQNESNVSTLESKVRTIISLLLEKCCDYFQKSVDKILSSKLGKRQIFLANWKKLCTIFIFLHDNFLHILKISEKNGKTSTKYENLSGNYFQKEIYPKNAEILEIKKKEEKLT